MAWPDGMMLTGDVFSCLSLPQPLMGDAGVCISRHTEWFGTEGILKIVKS